MSGVSTAKEMWQSILNLFERHTLLNKLAARRNFYTASMHDNEQIITYVNRVRLLASTLKSMGVEIDDKELAMAVLNGLPERFDSLICALDALGNENETFTLEFVKSRLLQEEQRMKMRMEATNVKSEASALVSSRPDPEPSTKKCKHCGKKGHRSERCWKEFPELAPAWIKNGRKEKEPAFIADNDAPSSVMTNDDFACLMARARESGATKNKHPWIIDSGCTSHMTFDRNAFSTYTECDETVVVGTKQETKVAGRGTIDIKAQVDGRPFNIKLMDVLHVPAFGYQLLSVSRVSNKGLNVQFSDGRCRILRNNSVVACGTLRKSLYYLDLYSGSSEVACPASLRLWHERLAHVDMNGISSMVKRGVVKGVNISGEQQCPHICVGCIYGKGHQAPIPKSSTSRRSAVLDLVHSDVLGPVNVPSLGGSRYFITFIDDYSKWTTVYTMRNKSESLECFKKFHKYAETHTGNKMQRLLLHQYTSDSNRLKALRTDNGGEYLSNEFKKYLADHGIHHQLTVAYTPQQNGVAERMNRTLMNLVRSMLHHKSIDKRFWAEALATAVYVRNRVTSRGLPLNLTPHHIWMGCAPNLEHMRVFGYRCWYCWRKGEVVGELLGLFRRSTGLGPTYIGRPEVSRSFPVRVYDVADVSNC